MRPFDGIGLAQHREHSLDVGAKRLDALDAGVFQHADAFIPQALQQMRL